MYLSSTIDDGDLVAAINRALVRNAIPFLVFFLSFTACLLAGKGFMADSSNR